MKSYHYVHLSLVLSAQQYPTLISFPLPQASAETVPTGQSPCMAHVELVNLWRVPLVLTMDVDSKFDPEATNWIQTNCVVLTLTSPVFVDPSEAPPVLPGNVPGPFPDTPEEP